MKKRGLWEKFLLTGSIDDYLDYRNKSYKPKKDNNNRGKDEFC